MKDGFWRTRIDRAYRFWRGRMDRAYASSESSTVRWFPELLFLDEARARAELWRTCYWRALRRNWVRLLLAAVLLSTLTQLSLFMLIWPFRGALGQYMSQQMMNMVVQGLGGGLFGLLGLWLFRSTVRRELRAELIERGFRVCRKCAYDLQGQPAGGRCPECGQTEEPAATASTATTPVPARALTDHPPTGPT